MEITSQNKTVECSIHQGQAIYFMKINQRDNNQIFYCEQCIAEDESFQSSNYDDDQIYKKWPPINNKNIIDQITKLESMVDVKQNLSKISEYFSMLRKEISEKINQVEEETFNKVKKLSEDNKKTYQMILNVSKSNSFKQILTNQNINTKQKEIQCIEIINKAHQQMTENEKQLQDLLTKNSTINFVEQINIEAQKQSIQQDLDAAKALLEQANDALDNINKDHFRTIKAWSGPPPGVPEVFSATIFLLAGYFNDRIEVDKNKRPKDVSWKSALSLMKSPDEFIFILKIFKDAVDANQVPASNVNTVKNIYLSMPRFTPESMVCISGIATAVCQWVINMVKYYDIILNVELKRKALKEATDYLEKVTIKHSEVEEIVGKLNEDLSKQTIEFDKVIDKKNNENQYENQDYINFKIPYSLKQSILNQIDQINFFPNENIIPL